MAEFAVGEPAPVVENAAVALLQAALFGIRALIKRYLLGMVAHAQQGGAVVGFAVLAVDVEVFESAPDQMGK